MTGESSACKRPIRVMTPRWSSHHISFLSSPINYLKYDEKTISPSRMFRTFVLCGQAVAEVIDDRPIFQSDFNCSKAHFLVKWARSLSIVNYCNYQIRSVGLLKNRIVSISSVERFSLTVCHCLQFVKLIFSFTCDSRVVLAKQFYDQYI